MRCRRVSILRRSASCGRPVWATATPRRSRRSDHYVDRATVEQVTEAMRAGHMHADIPDVVDFEHYVADGGYRLLRRFLGQEAAASSRIR